MNSVNIVSAPRKVLWKETLRNILYTHKVSTVEFAISDIAELCKYIEDIEHNHAVTNNKLLQLSKKMDRLNNQLLVETLKPQRTEKLNKFSVYA